ncbi:MAG: hypothetical protein FRX49_12300 [Trebouxia sp. A1-2]|nr:MAG: hypothetical protein FRX49_12300 [Trebouxia sp. A1-2]
MPPKPAAAAKSVEDDAADHEKEFVEKELIISFLKTRLSRHQERGEVLLVENARLGQDLETQKLNLADINEFLTSELDKTSAKLIQLEDKAGKVQQRLDELVENHVKEVVEIEKAHSELLEERDSTIHDMEKKVKTSQQFLEQKDSMDSALQQLQHTLEHERKKHQQDIGDLERQHVQDKDAWKKNTAVQLKEMRERMQKLSENQLETLTKRTILENEAMAAELKYQSRQVMHSHDLDVYQRTKLDVYFLGLPVERGQDQAFLQQLVELMVVKNQALLTEKAELRRQGQLAEQTEQELAKKSQVFQKTIKNLLSKMMEENESKKERDEDMQELQESSHQLAEQVELLRQQLSDSQAQSSCLEQEILSIRAEQSQVRGGQDEVLYFLHSCMDDIHRDMLSGDNDTGGLSQMSLQQRRHALVILLTRWQAFKENKRDRSPRKNTHGRRGDSIKAAKSLQRPLAQAPETLQLSDNVTNIPSQTSPSGAHADIGVVDSVLSLEGSLAGERGWGRRVEGKHMPNTNAEQFLKKGLGILSSQHKSYLDLSH